MFIKTMFVSLSMILLITISYGQTGKEIGAGVLDFLLSSPKTYNKMSTDQRIAAGLLSDLLKTQAQRQHEINYAESGADKIIINTDDGRQAQVVKDVQGNVYLLYKGTIYPVAQSFVNQVKKIDHPLTSKTKNIGTLEPYNMDDLQKAENDIKYTDIKQVEKWRFLGYNKLYRPEKYCETLNEVASKYHISVDSLMTLSWRAPLGDKFNNSRFKKKFGINEKIKRAAIAVPVIKYYTVETKEDHFYNGLLNLFTCKWHRDFDNNGEISFDEFNNINRTFYTDENFEIVIQYSLDSTDYVTLTTEIYNESTGEIVNTTENKNRVMKGCWYDYINITAGKFPVGIYIINIKIELNSLEISSGRNNILEKFEIIS